MIKKSVFRMWGVGFIHLLFSVFVVCSSIWLCCALWIQEPLGVWASRVLIGVWIAFALSVLGIYVSQSFFGRRLDILVYMLGFILGLTWYFGLDARQDREWNPEVAKILRYEKQGDRVTLHNVRNFNWHSDGSYTARWDTRTFDLNQITGINVITSYWMGPQIAHTLVSFDFANAAPLTFSIEIRKEKDEEFSAIGGFFRKYELSLVASDEHDIIYTRSNVRHEDVYFFPIRLGQAERKALFIEYLRKADELAQHPQWYNTLTSNCTTLVFDMAQAISKDTLPMDYRILASGYLPDYLHDLGAISPQWDIKTWYQRAYINPRVSTEKSFTSRQYSERIRQGLPVDPAH